MSTFAFIDFQGRLLDLFGAEKDDRMQQNFFFCVQTQKQKREKKKVQPIPLRHSIRWTHIAHLFNRGVLLERSLERRLGPVGLILSRAADPNAATIQTNAHVSGNNPNLLSQQSKTHLLSHYFVIFNFHVCNGRQQNILLDHARHTVEKKAKPSRAK